jgi:acyl-coenzyme A synthetase/AMP-(fatty) acid ligase
MMRGYWSRPDLTEAAFFRRELVPGLETVFYRTGDLVRQRRDGNLVFMGRKDRQVKVRGYRVELDEVEAVLCALADVSEAGVVDVLDSDGQRAIFAAVLPRSGAMLDRDELRRAVARTLPAYAVPSAIEIRDTLPRTPTGKIDRRVLRDRWRAVSA